MDSSKSILLVDDDNDLRIALALYLRAQGLHVRTAANGIDALRELQAASPSVIIVDLKMPFMDGWEFLRNCPPGIPIVVVSGGDDGDAVHAHVDVVQVLQKPVRMPLLLATLEPLLGRSDGGRRERPADRPAEV